MRGEYVKRTWTHDPTVYAPRKYRRACSYQAFIPERIGGLRLHLPSEVVAVISEAEQAITSLNQDASGYLAPLARLLLRTESIASSKVEGLQVDTRALAKAEANQETGRRVGVEAQEILASIDAMQLAVEDVASSPRITTKHLTAIHNALLSKSLGSNAGRIREEQNWIGGNDYNPCGAAFVPPPHEHVKPLLRDLCGFSSDDSLSPLLQAAIAHAQFETIHPFIDGNGRTGRALIHIILRRRGLAPGYVPPVSVVLARTKARYIDGLSRFRDDEVAEWVQIFAESAARAATLAAQHLERVRQLQVMWHERLRTLDPRPDAAAWKIIDILPAHPVITIGVAAAETRRTRPAVVNGLDQLAACGVLSPLRKQSPHNRAWEAVELLDLIARMDEGK